MPKVRNVSGDPLVVPALGSRMVLPDQVVEVPEDQVYNFTASEVWAPADSGAEQATEAGESDYLERLREANPAAAVAFDTPGGNASREAWVDWVVASDLAPAHDLTEMSRDEIRDTYRPQED